MNEIKEEKEKEKGKRRRKEKKIAKKWGKEEKIK